MSFLKESREGVKLFVSVKPNSAKSEIIGIKEDSLIVKLNALPKDNEANKELIKILSKILKIPKSNIQIIKGKTGRNKTLLFASVSINYLTDKLT